MAENSAVASATVQRPSSQPQQLGKGTVASTPSKNDHGWRKIIRSFSPSWFAVTMGTGVVATLFVTIPWKAAWLHYLGIVFFILNLILFLLALIASILRYTIWPEIWKVMLEDEKNRLFLGAFPIGLATLIEMWTFICVPAWGEWAAYVGWAMWMLDSVIAITVTIGMDVVLMTASHHRTLDSITAVHLIPIAATIVAAGTGAEVSSMLPNPQHALGTIIVCYIMWGMAIPLGLCVLVIYYQRLALHKIPPPEVIVSAFIPIGPLGFGGYTILYLGKRAAIVFPETTTIDPLAGQMAHVLGFFVSLIMWGWGLVWFAWAIASIYKTRPFPFNMGWWGFIFPLGVYSASTILIGETLPSKFFRVLGTVFSAIVIVLWVFVATKTAIGGWEGRLFHAPCLANLQKETTETERSSSEIEKQIDGQKSMSNATDQNLGLQHSKEAPDITH